MILLPDLSMQDPGPGTVGRRLAAVEHHRSPPHATVSSAWPRESRCRIRSRPATTV